MELYTTEEVARILKITRQTVYNYINDNKLDVIKMGNTIRVPKDELNKFIDKYRSK